MELALEAGAEDVRNEGEVFEVLTSPVAFHKVKEAWRPRAAVEAAEITYLPQNTVPIDAEAAQSC
jgi:transcriptional/translational regulatory protein YebC/TACO1